MQKSLGGDRLGSGNRMKIDMHGYSRSNHDLSHIWKSTMAPGTLVPFLVLVALPGDTFDIDLNSIVKTHPTIGPLFGSFKLQLDIFECPMRLYNAQLHNNKLNIGMNISDVKFPIMVCTGEKLDFTSEIPVEFQQINQSSLLAYLGIRGIGRENLAAGKPVTYYNAMPFLAYWDIFKNYYANKQEEYAYYIHGVIPELDDCTVGGISVPTEILTADADIVFTGTNISYYNLQVQINGDWYYAGVLPNVYPDDWVEDIPGEQITIRNVKSMWVGETITAARISPTANLTDIKPNLQQFTLSHIDDMREDLLGASTADNYIIAAGSLEPYGSSLNKLPGLDTMYTICGQEGLAVKTYQSDIFNNWIQTDWIEGPGSISAITAISTAGDSFTLDTLMISKKVYDLLNRIAVSGGSYDDWVEATYDHSSKWRAESPKYHGGLSKEIVFQEVISSAATVDEPLGSLAGKGVMSDKHKGGHCVINVDEPGYIIGIVSITPRLDYSQGNEWFTHLTTMDDLHKPALDGIGFQDLITEQMSFAEIVTQGMFVPLLHTSAGKQPAWMNYQTAYNRNYGNFADPRTQQYMTLDRRYQLDETGIVDLTTYIDPAKFNYAFAQTDLSAQNFWTQIAMNITARRKMSAKQIPNL